MKYLILLLASLTSLVACKSNDLPEGAECGRVSIFMKPPEPQGLYPVQIDRIDDRAVVKSGAYVLEPGVYLVKTYEIITDPRLKLPGRDRGTSKRIEIKVEANKRYHVAAKFIPEKRYSKRNEYWEPVVWQVTDEPCGS
ncbi:hypothetical protein DU002_11600 [Corallincola holothuriorum]|uniref:DUF2846 domain-containing protein n=1 Tax=Corallincola holothuriorum TaxID=2282215 RepID=A0A368NIS2_9GAMM|nr:hypothetical protein [Corallincola holothuriorum]RCU49554.1 hypothetical protein DU002_11600 [Corallincola holothuriorum]